MIETFNIDTTYTSNNIYKEIIKEIIKEINIYKLKYNHEPIIYFSVEDIDFLLYSRNFSLSKNKQTSKSIGKFDNCIVYLSGNIEKGNIYLSNKEINFTNYNRKLKLNKLNNICTTNKILK